MHHLLQALNISHAELGHVPLELRFLIVNLVLQFDDLLSQSQLICNGTVERDTDANWKLKIIDAGAWFVKPFINVGIQNVDVKEGQIVEDLRLFLALYQQLKSIITKLII